MIFRISALAKSALTIPFTVKLTLITHRSYSSGLFELVTKNEDYREFFSVSVYLAEPGHQGNTVVGLRLKQMSLVLR